MDFEEAFRYELNSIAKINNKIFPLYAPKDVITPFAVYKKNKLEYLHTLAGKLNAISAEYGFILISRTYSEAQEICKQIMNTVFGMAGREIGQGGPYIQEVDIVCLGDEYEYETDLIRTNFKIDVKY